MAAIRIFDPSEHDFLSPAEAYPDDVLPLIPQDERDGTRVRWHHPGSETELQLFEMQLDPGVRLAPHAHLADEIIAVLEGELVVGRHSYGPGASFHVPGTTVYTVQAGPMGCRFLNFRAAADTTYLTPSQALDTKRAAGSPDRT